MEKKKKKEKCVRYCLNSWIKDSLEFLGYSIT